MLKSLLKRLAGRWARDPHYAAHISRVLAWGDVGAPGSRARAIGALSDDALPPWPSDLLGERIAPLALSAYPELERDLAGITSETTLRERRLLVTLMATVWDGVHNVLEVGPFLGGTTRALGLGMYMNPRRQNSARLWTMDRFHQYYSGEDLRARLRACTGPALSPELIEEAARTTNFRPAFDALHTGTRYAPFLQVADGWLPDTPVVQTGGVALVRSMGPTSVFFVDGCKSWFSLRALFQSAADVAQPGACWIFQDYGWPACFWIPLAVEMAGALFRPLTCADNTYAFQMSDPKLLAEWSSSLPADVEALPAERIESAWDNLLATARARRDGRALVAHELNRSAALGYRGLREEARDVWMRCESDHGSGRFGGLVRQSRQSLTYRPSDKEDGIWIEITL